MNWGRRGRAPSVLNRRGGERIYGWYGLVLICWKGFDIVMRRAQDRRKVYSFLRRSARVGFHLSDLPTFDDLCTQANQYLFNKVLHNPHHVLHPLLPPVAHTSHNYCFRIRPRAHDRSLPARHSHLTSCNFIIRVLFYQVHWQYFMPACFIVLQLYFGGCEIHGMLCYAI